MAEIADLHLHTTFSDGVLSLNQVLDWIGKRHVKTFSITDHDTTEGLEAAQQWARQNKVIFIPGLELSVICQGQEVHLLSYFLDWKNTRFQDFLTHIRKSRLERTAQMVEKLKENGARMTLDQLIQHAGTTNLTRAHTSRLLLDLGYVTSIKEAFKRYIGHQAPCFIPVSGATSREGIEQVHQAGGLVFVAHPAMTVPDEVLNQLEEEGVDGIEAYHLSHSNSQIEKYLTWAREKNKLVCGGSDCHGTSDSGIQIGKSLFPADKAFELIKALEACTRCN